MQYRKWRTFRLLSFLLLLFLQACTTNTHPENGSITLKVVTAHHGDPPRILQDIAQKFMQENPNIQVNFSAPGSTYEDLMKIKMATNDMPDVFATHGWAKRRYERFLADLRDQPWVSHLSPTIKDTVTDENGKVYVLPIDQDKVGLVYNVDILNTYEIAVPTTYDEFLAACQTIKEKSHGQVVPLHIAGTDTGHIAQFFNTFSTPLLISPQQNYRDALLNGTFDWSKYTPLSEKLLQLKQLGYLNEDILTTMYDDTVKAFAEGKVAFALYGTYLITDARKSNPNLHGGTMPTPTLVTGDVPTFAVGEKMTWGVWKDSPHIEAAKKFVAFYARPENIARVAQSDLLPPGLDGVNVDLGDLGPYFQKYSYTPVFPFFDRVYLPSGMFQVLDKNGQKLLAGTITPSQFSENVRDEYNRLRASESP
jgi:raffinose/stachyose/melibiose transport system substrate-binding protein